VGIAGQGLADGRSSSLDGVNPSRRAPRRVQAGISIPRKMLQFLAVLGLGHGDHGQDAGFLRVQVVGHDPVVLVVRLFGVAQHETTLVDVGRTDDLHAVLAQFLQGRTTRDDTEPLPVPAWMIALAPPWARAL
jgi:hypothetical protein